MEYALPDVLPCLASVRQDSPIMQRLDVPGLGNIQEGAFALSEEKRRRDRENDYHREDWEGAVIKI